MKDITPDICDKHEDKVTLVELPLHNFGAKSAFWGEMVTVRCYHDNSMVRDTLSQDGRGKVLFVDGHGSCQKALLGDQLAILAIDNHWEVVVPYLVNNYRDRPSFRPFCIGTIFLCTTIIETDHWVFHTICCLYRNSYWICIRNTVL